MVAPLLSYPIGNSSTAHDLVCLLLLPKLRMLPELALLLLPEKSTVSKFDSSKEKTQRSVQGSSEHFNALLFII